MIGQGLPLLLFIIKSPLNFKFKISKVIVRVVLRRGLFLLFYNLSAGLILISSKTLVGVFYSVDDMGQFSFANGIAQTAIMGFSVISFILFPKLIEKFNKTDKISLQIFERTKSSYFYACYLTILMVIIILPYILSFFDDYADSYQAIVYLLLAQIILSTSFAHTIQLISNKKELKLGFIAFVSVLFNVLMGAVVIFLLDLDFEFIALGNILTAIIYACWTISAARKSMLWENKMTFGKFKGDLITFCPLIVCLINCLTYNSLYVYWGSLLLLLCLRYSEMRFIVKEAKHLMTDFRL
jgi:O-antigen/teichoic acid export membrane protein